MVKRIVDVEREAVIHALELYKGNRRDAAVALGISIWTLRNKVADYRAAGQLPSHLEPISRDPSPDPEELKPEFSTALHRIAERIQGFDQPLKQTIEETQIAMIQVVLRRTGNCNSQAAKILGLNRTTLVEKRKRYHIADVQLPTPDPQPMTAS